MPTGTPGSLAVMAVDNLHCELPRDASETFGNDLVNTDFPALIGDDPTGTIDRATICSDGRPSERYRHLHDLVYGDDLDDQ